MSEVPDQARAPRLKDESPLNGFVLLAVGVLAMIAALAFFVAGSPSGGVGATGLSAVALFAGGGWLFVVRRQERERTGGSPAMGQPSLGERT